MSAEFAEVQPKSVRAYAALREAIITMRLAPGEVVNEREFCARLEISRTPFREAVLRLAQEGLLRVVPSDATYVNRIVIQDVVEGHLIRDTLEARMVRLAAENFGPDDDAAFELLLFRQQTAARRADADEFFRLDNGFHRQICRTAGFPRVWDVIRETTGQLDRVRRRIVPTPGFFAEVLEEHGALIAALRAHDGAEAARILRRHLDDIVRDTRAIIAAEPDAVTGPEAMEKFSQLLRIR